jgi:hypothetical protein
MVRPSLDKSFYKRINQRMTKLPNNVSSRGKPQNFPLSVMNMTGTPKEHLRWPFS